MPSFRTVALALFACSCSSSSSDTTNGSAMAFAHHPSIPKLPSSSSPSLILHENGKRQRQRQPNTAMSMKNPISSSLLVLSTPRAGGELGSSPLSSTLSSAVSSATSNPTVLFDTLLAILAIAAVGLKAMDRIGGVDSSSSSVSSTEESEAAAEEKPAQVKSLQLKFLTAFWLLRCGYWMSGAYVVPAFKAKVFTNGVEATMSLVSKIFLSGFAATAILGPSIGQATDKYGRKGGTIMFALLYGLGVASIRSNVLWVLFGGRAIVGCALGLLFTAPEAWVGGEAGRLGLTDYLGETFGLAYTGDALVAILAGKLASWAASIRGVCGPFDLSIVFLFAGAVVSGLFWKENKAVNTASSATDVEGGAADAKKKKKSGIKEAFDIVRKDKKLMLLGTVQSLFEAAMYVFILQWPNAISSAVSSFFGEGAVTPFGIIFSCFMTGSLLGSILFSKSIKSKNTMTETTATNMLGVSAISMGLAAFFTAAKITPLGGIMGALLAYEACVGMYFPAMGTLRSKYVPDDHKTVILSLFGIPLNTLVVIIYLSIKQLGMSGALAVSSGALAIATGCMMKLRSISKKEAATA